MDRHGGKLMDADSIKISVIVPVYQVESYLKKCVDSILAQTHRNLEIFLVDDGSPDGCGRICEEYARRDGRVTVVHKSNGGLSDARNAGLERTNGDYIGFVDSDDWVENDMLEALLDLCLSRNAGIAVCEKYIVENDRVVAPPYSPGEEPVTVYSREEAMVELTKDQRIDSHVWNKLFRRELFDGIRFPVGKVFEDVFVMHRLFGRADRIAFSREPKYYYLIRGGSIVNAMTYRDRLDLCEAVDTRYRFLRGRYPMASRLTGRVFLCNFYQVYNEVSDMKFRRFLRTLKMELPGFYRRGMEYCRLGLAAGMRASERLRLQILRISPAAYYLAKRGVRMMKACPPLLNCCRRTVYRLRHSSERPQPLRLSPRGACRRVFLIGLPEYNNLGDHAIGYAEIRFLQKELPEYEIVPVTEDEFYIFRRKIRHAVRPGDILALQGGGNLGNEYPEKENIRQWVIRNCRRNRVIVFPQTMYFTQDRAGTEAAERAERLYNAHPDLTLFAREKYSCEDMKCRFPRCRVELIPDMALYLRPDLPPAERKGAGICIRGDVEGRVAPEDFVRIGRVAREYCGDIRHFSTCVPGAVFSRDREMMLNRIWREFSRCQVVITDRLHGVLFAAITGTPCVAVGNYNHKVRGVCEWLKPLGYIRYCGGVDELPALLEPLREMGGGHYDPSVFRHDFEILKRAFTDNGGEEQRRVPNGR